MSRVSLNARRQQEAEHTDEVEVVLMQFEHASLAAPIRVSTDPTERISAEPLLYGTRSRWLDADPATEPFLALSAYIELPGDQEQAPAGARITLEVTNAELVTALRGITTRAIAHLCVVLASAPDEVELEFRDLRLIDVSYDAGSVSLVITRNPIEDEGVPCDRITKERFPGLFR
ncbi:hypothetical protein [Tropicibacter sp. S64]|uniref:hypothetical protein n=1 Tax=Tropicibacter sp. S64 TaxID=3415122 RepID=UPI003C7CC217